MNERDIEYTRICPDCDNAEHPERLAPCSTCGGRGDIAVESVPPSPTEEQ